jgi:hypothetical protein
VFLVSSFSTVSCVSAARCLQKLEEWRAAAERFSHGTSALRGVSFLTSRKVWRAHARNPSTGRQDILLRVQADVAGAQQQCGRAYDRAQIKWRGR